MYECLPFITEGLLKQQSINEILKCNEETAEYQLTLSKEEAVQLMDTRKDAFAGQRDGEICASHSF